MGTDKSEPISFIPDAVREIKPLHLIWLAPTHIQLDKGQKENSRCSSLPENKYSEVMYINANTGEIGTINYRPY